MVTVIPELHDGVVALTRYTGNDAAAHLAGEDEETARRFGWWPATSTEASILRTSVIRANGLRQAMASQAPTVQYRPTKCPTGATQARLVLGLSLFFGRARSGSTTIHTLCIMNACR